MRKRNLFLFLFLILIFTPVHAQEVKGSVSVDDLIQEALANNREIKAARQEFEAAGHRVPQASALPDPTVGYAVMGPMLETTLGPQKDIYEFEQMVPFPGKLLERRKMAQTGVTAASARLKETEREVALKVKETYYDLYAIEANLKILNEVVEALKKFESAAQARYASQQAEQRDVAKAQAKISETIQQVFVLRQERETLAAMLNALLNREVNTSFEGIEKPPVPALNWDLEKLLEEAQKSRPELLEAKAMRQREQHASNLAKYEYAPDLSVGFQYYRIGNGDTSMEDDGRDAWMIPIKITLPLWQNRIGPGVLEAKKNLEASQANLEQTENLTEYEIKNAYYKFTSAKQIVELYENALIPQAEIAFRSDQAGYEAGRTDVLNLIDSEEVYLNSQMAYYNALSDALKSFAALERIVGRDINREGGGL